MINYNIVSFTAFHWVEQPRFSSKDYKKTTWKSGGFLVGMNK